MDSLMFSIDQYPKICFELAVTQAVDAVLSSLGNAVKQATYSQLESSYGLRKEDIPSKTEDFAAALENIFGPASKLIEISIIEKLHSTCKDFSYVSIKDNFSFIDFVHRLESYFESQTRGNLAKLQLKLTLI